VTLCALNRRCCELLGLIGLGEFFSAKIGGKLLKNLDSVEKNKVKIVSRTRPTRVRDMLIARLSLQ
jgi:hypothetical protein